MSRESDLLFGLLALQLGFITKEQLLECAAVWMSGAQPSLAGLLRQRGYVREFQETPLRALVEAQLRQHGGDAERTLASRQLDPGLTDALMQMSGNTVLEKTVSSVRRAPASPPVPPAGPTPGDRYRLGAELGRGGLGKVVEAHDAHLKRTVAVKLVLEGLPAELQDRFAREAELAGRLEHPNIVPVYDFGRLAGTAGGQGPLFMAMKRVRGRNLGEILKALRKGEREARETWSRLRLLHVFQDICQGVAFAHDRSVIHRDLKPANVMIGDYGETLILDWGLARVTSEPPPSLNSMAEGRPPAADASRVLHTLDGEVLGTPSYMPPEQAEGRMADVDHRSDVYSLGAILYEILTYHPPVEGRTVEEIISRVRNGEITPPSRRTGDAGGSGPVADPTQTVLRIRSTGGLASPVPPELEGICLKALAFDPSERHASAMALHEEIHSFLEGVRDAERRARLADEAATRAQAAADRAAAIRSGLPGARAEMAQEREALGKNPTGGRDRLWSAQDRELKLRVETAEAAAEADAAAAEALGHDAGHLAARRVKATLAWMRFEDAEAEGQVPAMVAHRRVVEQHNDGGFDERLRGEGRLNLRTVRFPCRCLRDGREFAPSEIAWEGWNPLTGVSITEPQAGEGVPGLGPTAPVRLLAHGDGCRTESVPGAHVWLWRYEEEGRLKVPVTPPGAGLAGAPAAPLEELFGGASPVRPRGPGLYAGRSPIRGLTLPMGSWLAVIAADGVAPRRVPVAVVRLETAELEVTLFEREEIPPGCLPVQGGALTLAGDRGNPLSPPARAATVSDFFYAVHPVRCGEYAEFLGAIGGEGAKRAPRFQDEGGTYWPGPPWEVPTAARIATWSRERAESVVRLQRTPFDWEDDWPVVAVSWRDALAWCAWRRSRDRRPWTLATSAAWERAVRGADQRVFSMGDSLDSRWANGLFSFPKGHPAVHDAFPHDESPFGIRHLTGNARTLCLNRDSPPGLDWRAGRGGDWAESELYARCSFYAIQDVVQVSITTGFRPAVPIRLGTGVNPR